MRSLSVIGIGAGNPDHLTLGAVRAMGSTEVFFVLDKGTAPELLALRATMLDHHAARGHRVVAITDPARDRNPANYREEVERWHHARATRVAHALTHELSDSGVGAFLVWGDPCLYDSTLRVLEHIRSTGEVAFDLTVIPGITSIQALAASHQIPWHGIGEPMLITTGRQHAADLLSASDDPGVANILVMLDGRNAFTEIDPTGWEIRWGAYLGTAAEITIAGPLAEVADRIVAARTAARAQHGWIMDTYLLRRDFRGDFQGDFQGDPLAIAVAIEDRAT